MLTLESVSKRFRGGNYGVREVSLDLAGGVLGLLGPNGAGKTTLMQMIATITKPTSGRIAFRGTDLARDPDALRRKLGYLPQDFGVYDNLTAVEFLSYFASLKGVRSRARVQEMLELVNLHSVSNRPIGGFSGGMKQRLGIAQALINDPELVIVDEPTAGLDPEERNRFLNLLAAIGDNVVVILSTHIVADVADLCPLMAVLANGRLQLEGKPLDLIESTRGKVWRKAIKHDELASYQAKYEVISTRLFAGNTIIHVLADQQPEGFEPVEGGLEDVYFSTLSTLRRAA